MPEQHLMNVRDHAVELHLPDRVVVLGPGETVTVGATGGQVDELVRRGIVEIQTPEPEKPESKPKPSRQRRPRTRTVKP